jgi:signal transduction histidine kinase
MSHELRTPLNAILGYTELMGDGAYGEPSEKMLGILKRLEANGKHLLGLINDVLDLSKIEAGQLVLELSDYCVQDIAQTVRSTLEPLASDKKLAFKLELAPNLPPGHGDGRRLTQVLINLVGNAIKFTDTGEVAIKAEANNGSFYVCRSVTLVLASPQPIRPSCSRSFSRPTMPSPEFLFCLKPSPATSNTHTWDPHWPGLRS